MNPKKSPNLPVRKDFLPKDEKSSAIQIVDRSSKYEKLIADSKSPSWWDTRVTVVLSLDDDPRFIGETLDAAGVLFGTIGGHGMAWFDVPANERERALLCLQSEPRLGGRFIDLQRCSGDQAYYEVNRIPRRVDTWPKLPGD